MRKRLFILWLPVLFACNRAIDHEYVSKKMWEYDSGFSVGEGDFMHFSEKQNLFSLRGDTIYYKGRPKAILASLSKKYFNLTVRSIESGELGYYRNIEESMHWMDD